MIRVDSPIGGPKLLGMAWNHGTLVLGLGMSFYSFGGGSLAEPGSAVLSADQVRALRTFLLAHGIDETRKDVGSWFLRPHLDSALEELGV